MEIAHDTFIYAVKSVTIVEIMGRDAGWLTAAAALARNGYNTAPHLIYLPEVAFDPEDFLLDVKRLLFERNNVIVAVSEGIRDASGNYISASEQSIDTFGHSQLSGAGKTLEFLVKEKLGVKVRSVEINVLQRCAAHLASQTDLDESFALGKKAVALSEEGVTASMVTIERTSNAPYTVDYSCAEIRQIANEAKSVPREWINSAGNDIEQPLLDYLAPLILGESQVSYHNGLPVYMDVSHPANGTLAGAPIPRRISIDLPISTHARLRIRRHLAIWKNVEHPRHRCQRTLPVTLAFGDIPQNRQRRHLALIPPGPASAEIL